MSGEGLRKGVSEEGPREGVDGECSIEKMYEERTRKNKLVK